MLRKTIVFLFFLTVYSLIFAQNKQPALVLENDFVRFEFEEGSYGLSAMIDKTTNVNHVANDGKSHRLFQITMRNGLQEDYINNIYIQKPYYKFYMKPVKAEVQKKSDGTQIAVIEWDNFEFWKEKNVMGIKVTVELPPNSGIAKWRISIDNRSDIWGIWTVKFPYFTYMVAKGEYDFAVPLHNGGKLYKKIETDYSQTYPSQRWTSQFFSLSKEKNSIYYAALDGGSRRKRYGIIPGKEFYIIQYAENMAVPGSDYEDHFPQAFGVFQGNWIDAAKMYRKWAVNQRWTEKGKKSHRKDMPDIIKNVALWFQVGKNFDTDDIDNSAIEFTINEIKNDLLNANQKLDVPIAVHWYKWHKIPYDTYYPHFLPGLDGFKEAVKELTGKGMLITPYINGLIADYDNPDADKFIPHCVKDLTGAPTLHRYGKTSGRLVSMCPTQTFWHNQIAGLVDTLTSEYGVNGVYIDQISAATPKLCFDKTHGHTLGGGAYWVDGYQKLLSKAKKIASPRGAILISESTAEPYMNVLDGFLTWHEPEDIDVPMLQMVYSDYTNYVGGRVSNIPPASDRAFIAAEARFFIWGYQNGWMNPWFMKPGQEKKAGYFKKIGKYRVATRKFVTYGELMDLVKPVNEVPTLTVTWVNHFREIKEATIPSIMGAVWKAEDGSLGILLVNVDGKAHEIKYAVDLKKYGIKTGANSQFVVKRITPGKTSIVGKADATAGIITRTDKIQPEDILVLEISK